MTQMQVNIPYIEHLGNDMRFGIAMFLRHDSMIFERCLGPKITKNHQLGLDHHPNSHIFLRVELSLTLISIRCSQVHFTGSVWMAVLETGSRDIGATVCCTPAQMSESKHLYIVSPVFGLQIRKVLGPQTVPKPQEIIPLKSPASNSSTCTLICPDMPTCLPVFSLNVSALFVHILSSCNCLAKFEHILINNQVAGRYHYL